MDETQIRRAVHQQLRPPHGHADLYLPEGNARLHEFFVRVMEHRDFQSATSERHQVHLVREWAKTYPERISLREIGDFFGLVKSTIQYHLSRPGDLLDGWSAAPLGRPALLNQIQEDMTLRFVQQRFKSRDPASYEDIRTYLKDRFQLIVDLKSLRAYIGRLSDVKTVVGKPMEDSRIFARSSEIDAYLADIQEVLSVAKIPAPFVVNIDEAGFEAYADRSPSTRIVPTSYQLNEINVPISRREKRATLLAGICADGSTVRPMVVLQRNTIDTELCVHGYTPDKIHYCYAGKGFIKTRLFKEWVVESFVPEMRMKRARYGYEGPILLIMDGLSDQHTEAAIEVLHENNIITRFIPPHTSNQLQPCDLGVFGNQKRWQRNVSLPKSVSRQTGHIIRMVDALRMATTPKNIISAFRKSGIVSMYDKEKMQLMPSVDVRYASGVVHLRNDVQEMEARRRISI